MYGELNPNDYTHIPHLARRIKERQAQSTIQSPTITPTETESVSVNTTNDNSTSNNSNSTLKKAVDLKKVIKYGAIAVGIGAIGYLTYRYLKSNNKTITLPRNPFKHGVLEPGTKVDWVWNEELFDYVLQVIPDEDDSILSPADLLALCDDIDDWSEFVPGGY